MAKKGSYQISFSSLKDRWKNKVLPVCLVINCSELILFDELITELGKNFIGDSYNETENLKWFYTDDKNMEGVLTECGNSSFFVEKKIIVLKVVKKPGYRGFTKQEIESFAAYFKNPNPDTKLIILDDSDEFKTAQYSEFENAGAVIYSVGNLQPEDFVKWVKGKFTGYEIDDNTIKYFCRFVNESVDEVKEEIEKLKIYSIDTKKITKEEINLCIGVSKDYSEVDFIQAVLKGDSELAFEIFKSVSIKKDFAAYALYLLSSAYIAISKLRDPAVHNLNPYELRTSLKLWNDSDRYIQVYKGAMKQMNELKLKIAFDYIYDTEVKFKSVEIDPEILITRLINNLVRL